MMKLESCKAGCKQGEKNYARFYCMISGLFSLLLLLESNIFAQSTLSPCICYYSEYGKLTYSVLSLKSVEPGKVVINNSAVPSFVFNLKDSSIGNRSKLIPWCIYETIKHNGQKVTVKGLAEISGDSFSFRSDEGVMVRAVPFSDTTTLLSLNWNSPYMDKERNNLKSLNNRIAGKFGDYRASPKKGHLHAGTDFTGSDSEPVFPISHGQVIFVSTKTFNGTVVIKHITKDDTCYSKYVHVEQIRFHVGQRVSPLDTLGRIFNKTELIRSRFPYLHLHLEIRKSYEDKGKASSYSMNLKELEKYCIDPVLWFKKQWEMHE